MKSWSFKKIAKEIATALLFIFVISLVLNYIRKPDVSENLPQLTMTTTDGKTVTLEVEGKPTVVHFWATWCPTCKLEAPNLESIQDEANTITIAVNSGSDTVLNHFMNERGYTYPVVNDSNGLLAQKFNVEVFPTTFIYDGSGKLQFTEVGYSTTLGLKARISLLD